MVKHCSPWARFLYEANILTGRRVFSAQKKQAPEPKKKVTPDNYYGTVIVKVRQMPEKLALGLVKKIIFLEGKFILIQIHFSLDDVARDTSSKTSYEVSIFVDDSWKKMNDSPSLS
ncbi:hypothetical protein CQW23_13875 [Capsicum baccatum]|uniref:Uncharacterized protein n=1 Tax=Capsicum baccatum TaxID=33114 RepID=A0A2G2WHI9_CAPBA|nr:hypothetical protein CQW23_13875 [Capsicum baccatum]